MISRRNNPIHWKHYSNKYTSWCYEDVKKPERSLIFCTMTVKSLLSIMNRTCFHILKYLLFDSATLFLGDTFWGNDKQNFIAPKYRKRLGKNLKCFYLVDVTALCCKNKTRHPQNRDTSFVFIKFIWARLFQERLESSLKVQQFIYNIFLMSCNFHRIVQTCFGTFANYI